MSTKFFDYESTFEVQDLKDENAPKNKSNVFKLVKSILINFSQNCSCFLASQSIFDGAWSRGELVTQVQIKSELFL